MEICRLFHKFFKQEKPDSDHKLKQPMDRIFKYSLLVLSLFLIAAQIWHVFNFSIWTDDACFGSVAKNLANGNGYYSTAFEENFLFDPWISLGPIVILPATLFVKIFGNQHWVPGITIVTLIWILLLTIFVNFKSEKKWFCSFLALLLCLLFSINVENYGIYNSDQFSLWYLMLGEIPAILLTILGALILFQNRMLLGGLVLGLAIMCKTLSGIACITIILVNAARIFFTHQKGGEKDFKKKFTLILLSGLGFVAPFFLFELVKIISLGWNSYYEIQLKNTLFYKQIALVESARPLEKIFQLFRIFGCSLFLLLALAGYLVKTSNQRKDHIFYWLGIALIICFFLHSLWWIFFSVFVNYRYFIAALFYCIFGISFLICGTKLHTKKLIALISLLILFRQESLDYLVLHAFTKNEKLDEQLLITKKISELQQDGISIISCGLNFELEYLLPKTRNFADCQNLPDKLPRHQFILVNDFVTFGEFVAPGKILMKNSNTSTVIKEPPSIISARCDEEYLTTKTFSLSWCK